MKHRTSAGRKDSITALLAASLALLSCTRVERAAPPSRGAAQQPRSMAAQQSSAALGFDSLITQKQSESTCYASARYVVVERDIEDQVGSDLHVRPRGVAESAPRCSTDSTAGDMVFRTGEAAARHPDAQHFLGLKGDLLVAWDGTGAASDIYIYDLNKGAKALVIEDADDTDLQWLSPMTVAIWVTKAYAQGAIAVGCPDTVPSMTPQMDSLMSLDLQTLTLRATGKYRCIVSQ